MVEGGSESLQFVDEAALAEPGVKEGQQKFVKDESGVKWLYQWSGATQTWEKIGEITGTDNSGASLGKRMYEGKEWDYLFDIDINGKMVRLPFNRGDDPWMAAQQWMWKNDIDQGFLDQVANHIIQNTPDNVVTATGNADPFTSGGGYQDPISAKRYRPGNAGAPAPPPAAPAAVAP